jgi:hypothetical protein
MGEVMNLAIKILSITNRNLIFLSKQVYDFITFDKKNFLFVGGFHFKGSIEPAQIFGFLWSDDAWLTQEYQNQIDILMEGDPSRYKMLQKDLKEKSAFKPMASFTVETKPTAVQIWLDSILIHKLTPFTINHKIGEYLLRAEKKGYKTIEKKIIIKPNEENQETLQMTSILGSIDIQTNLDECQIFFNGKEIHPPYQLKNLMPDSYFVEVKGDTHYSGPCKIDLHEAEAFVYIPEMRLYGRLIIISKLKDVDFLIKDAISLEKIKINDGKFSYTPVRQYKPGRAEEIFLKEGNYIIEPLDNKYEGITVEVKSAEIHPVDYDEHVRKKTIQINTGKYDTITIYKHEKTGEKGTVSIKGKKKINLIPGKVSFEIQRKLATREYHFDIGDEEIKIDFAKDIAQVVKMSKKKLIKKSIFGLVFLSILLFLFSYYAQFENRTWDTVLKKNSLDPVIEYWQKNYFFRFKKQAEKIVQTKEKEFWSLCVEKKDTELYEVFLKILKQSQFHQQAQDTHQKLLWEDAKRNHSPDGYKKFRNWYPESPFTAQNDSLYNLALWEKYKEKNSMIFFTYYIVANQESVYLEEAKLLRENVFYSMSTIDFWLDKWLDIKGFILSTENMKLKLIILVLLLVFFVTVYFNKRSVKIK